MTETQIAGWTAPNGDITIQVWKFGWQGFQVREVNHLGGPDAVDTKLFATEQAAREIARLRAEIIRWNQTGR